MGIFASGNEDGEEEEVWGEKRREEREREHKDQKGSTEEEIKGREKNSHQKREEGRKRTLTALMGVLGNNLEGGKGGRRGGGSGTDGERGEGAREAYSAERARERATLIEPERKRNF